MQGGKEVIIVTQAVFTDLSIFISLLVMMGQRPGRGQTPMVPHREILSLRFSVSGGLSEGYGAGAGAEGPTTGS